LYWHNRDRIWRFLSVAIVVALMWPLLRGMVADSLVARAQPYLVYGYPATGLHYLNRALFIDPDNVDALEERDFGAMFANTPEQIDRALTHVQQDAVAHPNDVFLWKQVMILAIRAHHMDLAKLAALRAYALQPDRVVALTIDALDKRHAR
jgi:hypothetical protein